MSEALFNGCILEQGKLGNILYEGRLGRFLNSEIVYEASILAIKSLKGYHSQRRSLKTQFSRRSIPRSLTRNYLRRLTCVISVLTVPHRIVRLPLDETEWWSHRDRISYLYGWSRSMNIKDNTIHGKMRKV